jgi:hypothetical protein
MPGTTANDLGSVQKTLLLPLWGRAVETKKARRLLLNPWTTTRLSSGYSHGGSSCIDRPGICGKWSPNRSSFPMAPHFRPISEDTVMCTVQGCVCVASFVFIGGINCSAGGRSAVAAYCDRHAEEAATRSGHPWPIPERRPPDRVERARSFRAG